MNETEPQGVTAMLGDVGYAPKVTHKGKTWTIGHPTQKAKAELEGLVVEASEKNLDDLKPILPAKKWQEKRKALDGHLFARTWQTFGELWAELCNGPLSYPLFLVSLARPHHPDMTIADGEELWRDANGACKRALAMVVPDFFDLLAAALPAEASDRQELAKMMKATAIELLGPATPTS